MDLGAGTMAEGHNAVVSNLKDIFNKRFAQREDVSQHHSREPMAVIPHSKVDVPEKIIGPSLPVVLITNDDGICAPGLRALVSALIDGGRCDVHVCAPDSEKSATGHSVTVRDNLVVESVHIKGATAYQVSGTPVDCVSLSLSGALFSWSQPALVISGINKGANCGYHIIYSGTVAGAREAFINGVPAIAISLNWVKGESHDYDFKAAAEVSLPLIYAALRDIKQSVYPKGCYYNVDIPTHPAQHKGYKVTTQGTSHMGWTWRSVTNQRRMSMSKETSIGAQLAQLGLAASAAGARRQNSLARNTPMEIESTGAVVVPNGNGHSSGSGRLIFRLEILDMEVGELNDDMDFGLMQQGFITITPLSLRTYIEPETQASVACWISSSMDVPVSSAL